MRLIQLFCVLALSLATTAAFAQSGKISGTVTDAETGSPLPGVNVTIEGTTQGATTNAEGFYSILNVSPGTYDVRASFVGFAPTVREGVQVNIGLTTEVNFALQEQTAQLEEVTVQATEPVVKKDISANIANLNSEEIENLPVSSIDAVVGLQAGAEGLSIRGGGLSELKVLVDGMSMRDGRDNTPFTGISYTSVKQVQVQTGGFNAEYGNVRSGLINVVTREGPRDHYTADVLVRYAPASRKYFGPSPESPNAYWMRPYLDSEVNMVGTDTEESPWDQYMIDSYPQFDGWQTVSDRLHADDNPENDLTPEQLVEAFNYYHRNDLEVTAPDYDLDASFGGPVPGVSDALGDLRFFASYRQTQSAYLVSSQPREAYESRIAQFKLTSNVASGMKLQLQGMFNRGAGLNDSYAGESVMLTGSAGYASVLDGEQLYGFAKQSLMDVTRQMVGANFTHTLGSNTFYELNVQRMYSDYFTRPPRARDPEIVKEIGPMGFTEAPNGWLIYEPNRFAGINVHGGAGGRDTSNVAVWTGGFDITSQISDYAQLKSGVELIYNDYQINRGRISFWRNNELPRYEWSRQPMQGAAYAQSKFEFQGLVANIGVRLDYFDPRGEWYDYAAYSRAFTGQYAFEDSTVAALEDVRKVPAPSQLHLSPRLGISYPITESSKLFFNYGHFRQMLDPEEIFKIRTVTPFGRVDQIGNPGHLMPKTVAYELGYEHNLFDQFLLRLSGYYRAEDNQPRGVRFINLNERTNYFKTLPNNYEDIRGFEVTLRKRTGRWLRGFVNYTYMARKEGNFGYAAHYENRADQREFERVSQAHYQTAPVPEPYARANIELLTPNSFGPSFGGFSPLGDWRLSLLASWRAGAAITWTGGLNIPGVENNVRWRSNYNLDLRFAKNINVSAGDMQFFVDVSNALNLRDMTSAGFEGPRDFEKYMMSLHLPESAFEGIEALPYQFIPGDDRPGDYRDPGVDFVPIEVVEDLPSEGINRMDGKEGPLYYVTKTGTYYEWSGSAFEKSDQAKVDQVLEDKAYINMPNETYFTFLNPRQIMFGLRFSF